jgi:hypothetical protein
MEGADAKISRAEEHLKTIQTEALAFLRSVVHRTILKADAEKAWFVYWIDDSVPPIRLSAVIGDCIFNMRSALDNLVCGLARTRQSDCACAHLKFPICSKPELWEKNWRENLKGVPADAQSAIKELQPCFRSSAGQNDPLLALNKLSNTDKHRAILLTTVHDRNLRFVIRANDGYVHTAAVDDLVYGGSPTIVPLRIHPAKLLPSVPVKTLGSGVIAFQETGPWADQPVHGVLNACLRDIKENVVPKLRPFFKTQEC